MNAKLRGQRILVTRPAGQAQKLTEMILAQGGEPVCFPLLEINPTKEQTPLQQAIAQLDGYSIAIFISPNAVIFSLPTLLAKRPWPDALQAAAIGQSTVAQLAPYGINNVIAPVQRFDSEALLELPAMHQQCVAGKKILLLRGNGGRELLATTLRERGAQVDCVTCYQRSSPTNKKLIVSMLRNEQIEALTISSSEGLHNLLALLDAETTQRLYTLPVFVPHKRIAKIAAELGLRKIILSEPADAGIMNALCSYNWPPH
jgi:uroporphyrinogen-III synthase